MDTITITLPLKTDYFLPIRLTVGGVCSLAEFDVDDAEDYKVCVTESLLLLMRSGFENATVSLTLTGDGLSFCAVGKDRTGNKDTGSDAEISVALLCALVKNVEIEKDEQGDVVAVRFVG